MKILLLIPFYTGSHKAWADGFKKYSNHEVEIFHLSGKHWKWRMHGAAISFAEILAKSDFKPDRIFATDMLHVAVFKALAKTDVPIYTYFHENQLTYPWSPTDEDTDKGRDKHYGFINYTSALASDKIFFNSKFHKDSFLKAARAFLKVMPDYQNLSSIDQIAAKSEVLYLGMDLQKFDSYKVKRQNEVPIILWNHRWEYDKNPEEFFEALIKLKEKAINFKLIVIGQSYAKVPVIFETAKKQLEDRIIHFGYADSFEAYATLLHKADILPVTNIQDFFGGSIVEAIYCGVYPLLPNRLTYPELLPETVHLEHIYKEALIDKLENTLQNWDGNYDSTILTKHMSQFDWRKIVDRYDSKF